MIIGITGKAQSGKDTSADILTSYFNDIGDQVARCSFAAPIRQMVMGLVGYSNLEEFHKIYEVPSAILGGKTPRYAM
jgi:hypothetical protein